MSLGASVRKEDGVGSAGGVTITLLVLAKVGAAVLVVHTVLEGILGRHGLRLLVAMGLGVAVTSGMANLMMNKVIIHRDRKCSNTGISNVSKYATESGFVTKCYIQNV